VTALESEPDGTGPAGVCAEEFTAAALAGVAAMFTGSPRVVTLSQADASHNLSVGWTALSYHLKILSFAEECAITRERPAAPRDPTPLPGG